MLAFSLNPESLEELSYVCEKYLVNQIEHGYSYSLTFIKKLRNRVVDLNRTQTALEFDKIKNILAEVCPTNK